MEQTLEIYCNYFKKLRRAAQFGGAPHKPILLLAVIDSVQAGEINSSQVYITEDLIIRFKELWGFYVLTQHKSNFALPFYHLNSEPFWKIVFKDNFNSIITSSKSVSSLGALVKSVLYAEIDKKLFELMFNQSAAKILKDYLIKLYFPDHTTEILNYELKENIVNQILNESKEEYSARLLNITERNNNEQLEEEIFVRGNLFKKQIPKLYNFTCAISRMSVMHNFSFQMVDACHIVPFYISKDDTVGNGICLSPNLHRAFDRGLITVSESFIVRVSPAVTESNDSPYSLKQFEGAQILLPSEERYYPLIQNFKWHRKEIWKI